MPARHVPTRKGHKDRTSPRRIMQAEVEAQALRLRRKGHSHDEIAEIMGVEGIDRETKVHDLIRRALDRKGKPDADSIRATLNDTLDIALGLAVKIVRENKQDRTAALGQVVNITNRIAQLNGTDAPKKVDISDDRLLPPDAAARAKFLEGLAEEARAEEQGEGGGDAGGVPAG